MTDMVERLEMVIAILERQIARCRHPALVKALAKMDQELAESRAKRHKEMVSLLGELKRSSTNDEEET